MSVINVVIKNLISQLQLFFIFFYYLFDDFTLVKLYIYLLAF